MSPIGAAWKGSLHGTNETVLRKMLPFGYLQKTDLNFKRSAPREVLKEELPGNGISRRSADAKEE